MANDFENTNQQFVCFCPLAIDELPLLKTMEEDKSANKDFVFPLQNRWNVRNFWKDEILLTKDEPSLTEINISKEQVQEAQGLISANVGWRDYRLVMQSGRIVVLNPWFNNKQTGGVRDEIALATGNLKPVLIYQDPKHDKTGTANGALKPQPSSLSSIPPGADYITFFSSPEALFKSIKDNWR